jgi:hypothetical protein
MEDRRDLVVEIAVGETREQLFLVDVFGDLAVDEIAVLVRVLQIVDRDDARLAAAFSARTRFAPMKPAAPVTMICTSISWQAVTARGRSAERWSRRRAPAA